MSKVLDEKRTIKAQINKIIDETIEQSYDTAQSDFFYKSKAEAIMEAGDDCFDIVVKRFKNEGYRERETIVKLLCHFPSIKSINFFKTHVQKGSFLPRTGNLILQHFNRCDVMIEGSITGNLIEHDAFYHKIRNEAMDNKLMSCDKFSASLIDELLKKREEALQGIIFQLVEEAGKRAAPILLKIAEGDEDLGVRIIKFISRNMPTETLKIVEWISSNTDNKKLMKEIKRIIHNFKLKGMKVDFNIEETEQDTILKKVLIAEPSAFSSLIDPEGNRALVLIKPMSPSEKKVFYFIISYDKGLLELNILNLLTGDTNKLIKKIRRDNSFFEVPLDYASFMIEKAINTSNEKTSNQPASLSQWKTYFSDIIGKRKVHPVKENFLGYDMSEDILSEEGIKDFIENYNMYVWFFSGTDTESIILKLKDVMKSSLVLSDEIKNRRIQDLINDITDDFFTSERISVFRSMLEDIAYIMHKKGKFEQSKTALMVATSLESSDIEPGGNLFCRMLIKTAIDFIISKSPDLVQNKEDDKNMQSGIITR